MKNKVLCLIFITCGFLEARTVVDKIVSRVNGINILKSDLKRSRINSNPYSLEEAITQELYFQEASRKKMVPSMIEVEKQIASYKTESNMTNVSDDQFEDHLKTLGFSLLAYKGELTRYIAVSLLLQNEIKSRVFVTAQEVEKYYRAHPEWLEEHYKLKTALIPFSEAKTKEEAGKKRVEWITHDDWIGKSNIAEGMSFIFNMKKGETSEPVKTKHGFQVVYLIDKKPRRQKALQESYVDTEKILRAKKMERFEETFREELKAKATIVHL